MNREIIVGGPGCGKTTALLQRMEMHLKDYGPDEIAFLGFTRKAAYEAKERAAKSLDIDIDLLIHCRTIHSLAFKALGLEPNHVMNPRDYKELGRSIGLDFDCEIDEDYGLALGSSEGEKLSRLEQICRVTGKPLEIEAARQYINPWKAKLYRDSLYRYKKARGLFDFTDMIELFIREKPIARIPIVFIDEAQDLSPIHWLAMRHLMDAADQVYIGGDDDQTIFQWAGADVSIFLGLEFHRKVLPVSHRLPRSVFQLAGKIAGRIRDRIPKVLEPSDRVGKVLAVDTVDDLPLAGEWLLLARHSYQLRQYIATCRRLGYPYELNGISSTDTKYVDILISWERLKKDKTITLRQYKDLVKYANKGVFDKKLAANAKGFEGRIDRVGAMQNGLCRPGLNWFEALAIPWREATYYRDCLRRFHDEGEGGLRKPPKIKISTIHGAKGGEADNVAIIPDLSRAAFNEYDDRKTADNELRVFYVGATRAKEALYMINPKTTRYFQL